MKALFIKFFLRILGDHEKAGRTKKFFGSLFLEYFPGQMTCRQFEAFIVEYTEGRLSDRQKRLFDWHMVICPMCRVYFDSYRQTMELSRMSFQGEGAEVSEDIPPELINAILATRHSR